MEDLQNFPPVIINKQCYSLIMKVPLFYQVPDAINSETNFATFPAPVSSNNTEQEGDHETLNMPIQLPVLTAAPCPFYSCGPVSSLHDS